MSVSIGRHDAVITTNFDNMLSAAFDALRYEYPKLRNASTIPILITMGDDEAQLSRFNAWTVNPEQPLIFHVHNSQHFNPRNTARDIGHYPQKTDEALYELLNNRCLLVMGYSGSDEGLMTVIKNSNCQRIYWLSHSGVEPTNAPFKRLKQKFGGNLKLLNCKDKEMTAGCPNNCPIGFDSFIYKLVTELCPEFHQNRFSNTTGDCSEVDRLKILNSKTPDQKIIKNSGQKYPLNTYEDKSW